MSWSELVRRATNPAASSVANMGGCTLRRICGGNARMAYVTATLMEEGLVRLRLELPSIDFSLTLKLVQHGGNQTRVSPSRLVALSALHGIGSN